MLFAASSLAASVCSWNAPGTDAYRGDVAAAVESYQDIPASVRTKLRARIERQDYDDFAAIRRDNIAGKYEYSGLRDMHFGAGRICKDPVRDGWTPYAEESGLVYCEQSFCLLVPVVCRNLSRITRGAPVGDLSMDAPGAGSKRGRNATLAALESQAEERSMRDTDAARRADALAARALVKEVPEPSSLMLVLLGLAGAWVTKRGGASV